MIRYRWYELNDEVLSAKLEFPRYFNMPEKWSLVFSSPDHGEPRVRAVGKRLVGKFLFFKIYRTIEFDSKPTPSLYPNEMLMALSRFSDGRPKTDGEDYHSEFLTVRIPVEDRLRYAVIAEKKGSLNLSEWVLTALENAAKEVDRAVG